MRKILRLQFKKMNDQINSSFYFLNDVSILLILITLLYFIKKNQNVNFFFFSEQLFSFLFCLCSLKINEAMAVIAIACSILIEKFLAYCRIFTFFYITTSRFINLKLKLLSIIIIISHFYLVMCLKYISRKNIIEIPFLINLSFISSLCNLFY